MHTLAEDLLLLALDDENGTVSWQRANALPAGLGGALLMDLALQERITSVDNKILVADPSLTGDALLDAALATIRDARRPRNAKHWVEKLGGPKGLRDELARRLVARGILREQEHTFLWVFHGQRFPTSDPGPESSLRGRLRDVVLTGAAPDTRTVLLLSLVNACDLAKGIFARADRKQVKRRIKELVEGEQLGKAVSGGCGVGRVHDYGGQRLVQLSRSGSPDATTRNVGCGDEARSVQWRTSLLTSAIGRQLPNGVGGVDAASSVVIIVARRGEIVRRRAQDGLNLGRVQ
jgi:hypothetical protein